MSQPIAVIGLGLMGSALAGTLSRAGFEVRGYDISEVRRQELADRVGSVFGSASEASEGLSLALTSLPAGDQVRAACLGPDGIATGLAPGALIIDTSTTRPEDAIETGRLLGKLGIGFVDACISGSSNMVARRDLVVMVGGSPENLDRSRPVLDAVARSVHHMGPVGAGARTKLVVNLVLGAHRLALAEGLLLAERAGLEPDDVLDVLRDGAAYSKAMDIWGPRMLAGGTEPPSSRLRQHHKDVKLMLEQGDLYETPLPLTAALDAVLIEAERLGLSGLDISGLIQVLRNYPEGEIEEEE
jgi:3-hydroxyisobutyrate dehydrogenase-like beta-hydroxyacid dehydrogenase